MRKRVSEITEYFKADIKTVWNVVNNNENYKWRSDLWKIEIIGDGSQWLEYYDDKNYTKFTICHKEQYKKYVLNMENKRFTGVWSGIFFSTETGGTKVLFTENIFIKNPIIHYISYVFWNLKKVQENYMRDLKKELKD